MNKIVKSIIDSLVDKGFPKDCKIFVLNTKSDSDFATELIQELRKGGFLCWDSQNCILPGQDHNLEQEKAIYDADFVIAIMSEATKPTEGRYQALLKLALEAHQEKSEGGIKLISVLIEETTLPYEYRKYKPLDLTDKNNAKMLTKSFIAEYDRRRRLKIKPPKPEAIWE